jgi:hypothetical protein
MTLSLGDDLLFHGPALPEAFVRHELEKMLGTHLPKARAVQGEWEKFRKSLRQPLTLQSGRWRIKNVVLDPLLASLVYEAQPAGDPVRTREGPEGPGLLWGQDTVRIRAFPSDYQADLDAPAQKGLTYRHTPQRIAERILLATGERVGLLTNGDELRLLLSDPARPASFVSFRLSAWRNLSPREVPDGYRLLLAFLDPKLLTRQGDNQEKPSKLEALLDSARLKQGQITKGLRDQARKAVEQFIQGVLDHPANRERFRPLGGEARERLPRQLWREALILVYRLLFILRGEASGAFRFGTTSPWRHTYSPGYALAEVARQVIDRGAGTGNYLEQGLRKLFEIFEKGLRWTEASIAPLGGRLFGQQETPLLSSASWSEVGCAGMLDKLLWTLEKIRGARRTQAEAGRRRINYADLDVEDLGRVYEALLELEPGLATEPMVRLRRAKLEVVVPAAQGAKYRPAKPTESADAEAEDTEDDEAADADDSEDEGKGKKSRVEFVEDIVPEAGSPGKFFLRVGLGRKALGSYYTPDSFVRFLVQETLRPQVEERSPVNDPQPGEILKLKVLDPAMGSGHFLVGACRYLGERLYEACRLCADKGLWDSIPTEVAPYLPGRVQEGEAEVGVSADRARAICKRLVAVHCLYGVDKNELAVELAKVCLWLESQADGMPLTFLDHRLVHGDSLIGPFWNHLITYPIGGGPVEGLFAQGVQEKFGKRLASALTKVKWLEQNVGATPDEIAEKQKLKAEIDSELFPFRVLGMAWSGAVMLGESDYYGLYEALLKHVAEHGTLPETLDTSVLPMLQRGAGMDNLPADRRDLYQVLTSPRGGATNGPALAYDLTFPEVFYPTGVYWNREGFNAILGNPPWEGIQPDLAEYLGQFDAAALTKNNRAELAPIERRMLGMDAVRRGWEIVQESLLGTKRATLRNGTFLHKLSGEVSSAAVVDEAMAFLDRTLQWCNSKGGWGLVLPNSTARVAQNYREFGSCHFDISLAFTEKTEPPSTYPRCTANGFHTNQSATGLRQHLIGQKQLKRVYGFINKKQLFEISTGQRFDLVCGTTRECCKEFAVCFGLTDDAVLFADLPARSLRYDAKFIEQLSPNSWTLPELSTVEDYEVTRRCYSSSMLFGSWLELQSTNPGEELHSSKQSARFGNTEDLAPRGNDPRLIPIEELTEKGIWPLHEKGTFDAFTDICQERPRYCVRLETFVKEVDRLKSCTYYRVAHRAAIHASESFKSVFAVLPPGVLVAHSAVVEKTPWLHPASSALVCCSVANSLPFNLVARQFVGLNLSKFIRDSLPWPKQKGERDHFLSHSALRLTCNHAGYAPLWIEQLGDTWREPKPPLTWPVLATENERWEARAVIDAVVADAYGLNRDQYAHVLSTFSHKSYPQAPALCLAKFDEMKQIGLDAFTKKYDPYWDIPLNESLPKPVIDLPVPAKTDTLFRAEDETMLAKPRRKKR